MNVMQFKDVFDLKDDEQLKDLISRVAARIVLVSKGGIDELVANPVAIQMIAGYMEFLFNKLCEENNIERDLNVSEEVEKPDFFNIHKETKH